MLKPSAEQHANITFAGMALVAAGLPLSVFLISVGLFVLAGNWLLERNFKQRLGSFVRDPLSMVLTSVYALHLVGVFWSEDLAEVIDELRIKLPLLLMPLLLFTSKMPSPKRIQDVLMLFVVATVFGSVLGYSNYLGIWNTEVTRSRDVSMFISHIQFGLMIAFSIFILLAHLVAKRRQWSLTEKMLALATSIWLFYFLVLMESLSALVALTIALVVASIWLVFSRSSKSGRIIWSIALVMAVVGSFIYVNGIHENHQQEIAFDHRTLNVLTANGRYYSHQTRVLKRENGHRVWNFVCWDELNSEWPKRSKVNLSKKDQFGFSQGMALVHYMTSKGLKKDSAGVQMLTDDDILNIEKGYTNYRYTGQWGISKRLDAILDEWDEYLLQNNPNNSSGVQRWVSTLVGLEILKQNLLLGVGTGDLPLSYKKAYSENNHGLHPQFQIIAHNQFLAMAIQFGLLGGLWFLFATYYPLRNYRKDHLYLVFLVLITVSYLGNTTLDTQSGVTFFAFFNALLIVRNEYD